MGHYFLAHDIGTSGDKAALVDEDGRIIRSHTSAYSIDVDAGGIAQQNPEDWWNAFCINNKVLLQGVKADEIAAVAVSGQMMACIPVDYNGCVLHPAMISADRRSVKEIEWIEERVGENVYYETTGMRPSEAFPLAKMRWLMLNKPRVYEKTYKFLAAKDFINFRLTGRFATDREDAAYMHAYDIRKHMWSEVLLHAAGISIDKMPEIINHSSIMGVTSLCRQEECGIFAGTPVVMCAGDGDAATLGAGVVEVGDAYTNVGTSGWVSILSGSESMDPLHRITKADCFGIWRDSGTMQTGGYSYKWIIDRLCRLKQQQAHRGDVYAAAERIAGQAPAGSNGVLFLPHLMGERSPYWDAGYHGAFLGLRASTDRSEMIRSVMEGVALHLGIILQIMKDTVPCVSVKQMRLIGGGGKSPLWQQIFADVYGLPVIKTNVSEHAGTLGCAVMAGIGTGHYEDYKVIHQLQKIESITEPHPGHVRRYEELRDIVSDAAVALTDINHRIADFHERG